MLTTPRALAIRELIKDAIITAELDDLRGVALLELVDSISIAPTVKILRDTLERAETAYLIACGWTRVTDELMHSGIAKVGSWLPPKTAYRVTNQGTDQRVYRDVPHAINSQRKRERMGAAYGQIAEDETVDPEITEPSPCTRCREWAPGNNCDRCGGPGTHPGGLP